MHNLTVVAPEGWYENKEWVIHVAVPTPFLLVVGENAGGKSAVIRAIEMAVYGRSYEAGPRVSVKSKALLPGDPKGCSFTVDGDTFTQPECLHVMEIISATAGTAPTLAPALALGESGHIAEFLDFWRSASKSAKASKKAQDSLDATRQTLLDLGLKVPPALIDATQKEASRSAGLKVERERCEALLLDWMATETTSWTKTTPIFGLPVSWSKNSGVVVGGTEAYRITSGAETADVALWVLENLKEVGVNVRLAILPDRVLTTKTLAALRKWAERTGIWTVAQVAMDPFGYQFAAVKLDLGIEDVLALGTPPIPEERQ